MSNFECAAAWAQEYNKQVDRKPTIYCNMLAAVIIAAIFLCIGVVNTMYVFIVLGTVCYFIGIDILIASMRAELYTYDKIGEYTLIPSLFAWYIKVGAYEHAKRLVCYTFM